MSKELIVNKTTGIADKLDAAIGWSNACYGDASVMSEMLNEIYADLLKLNVELVEGQTS